METAYDSQVIISFTLIVTLIVIWVLGHRNLRLMRELQERQFKEAEHARQRDRREKWLDYIEAWALRSHECVLKPIDPIGATLTSDSRKMWAFESMDQFNYQSTLSAPLASSEKMILLALSLSEDLLAATQHLADDMQALSKCTAGVIDIVDSATSDRAARYDAALTEQQSHIVRVRDSAVAVIKKATDITIRDIDAS